MKKQYQAPKFYRSNPQQIAWDMLRGITENDRKYLKLFRWVDNLPSDKIPTSVYNRLVKRGFFKPNRGSLVFLSVIWQLNKNSMRYD